MNTIGDMNMIVVANSVGSGNSGSVASIIPQASPMNPPALAMDKGMQWIGQIRLDLHQMGVPFNISTGPIQIFWKLLWWEHMVPIIYAAGCVHWRTRDRAAVHVSHSPQHVFHAAVVAMHELGHLHTDTVEARNALWNDPKRFDAEFKKSNEIAAWEWAKKKMAGDWDQEAEYIALRCLESYGVIKTEI